MNDLVDPGTVYAKQYVLDKIASGEAPGYNVLYGGSTFEDLSAHPNVEVPIKGGHGFSTAAGRYQFLKPTWDAEAKALGLKDFSPASQDAAAWDLATKTYGQKTGRDLMADAKARTVDWASLGGQWESLKGAPPSSPSEGSYEITIPDTPKEAPLGADVLTKLMAREFAFTPVDYDPFAVEKKLTGSQP